MADAGRDGGLGEAMTERDDAVAAHEEGEEQDQQRVEEGEADEGAVTQNER